MKTLIYILLLAALPTIGFAQNNVICKLKDHPAMKKNDIENYEENKRQNENGNYTYEYDLNDGAKVRIGEFVDIEGNSVYSEKIHTQIVHSHITVLITNRELSKLSIKHSILMVTGLN